MFCLSLVRIFPEGSCRSKTCRSVIQRHIRFEWKSSQKLNLQLIPDWLGPKPTGPDADMKEGERKASLWIRTPQGNSLSFSLWSETEMEGGLVSYLFIWHQKAPVYPCSSTPRLSFLPFSYPSSVFPPLFRLFSCIRLLLWPSNFKTSLSRNLRSLSSVINSTSCPLRGLTGGEGVGHWSMIWLVKS